MKRTIFVLLTILVVFATVFAVLVVHPLRTVNAQHHGCSNRTLFGDYGMTVFGYESSGEPASIVGLLHFDGTGNLTGSKIYIVTNGTPSSKNPNTLTGATYDISSDCTITMLFSPTWTSHGVLVGAYGSEVIADVENGAGTATMDIKKVSDTEGHASD